MAKADGSKNHSHLKSALVFAGVVAVLLAVMFFAAQINGNETSPASCTIITAKDGDTVLFGNNEDHTNPEMVVGFYTPAAAYGSVHVGQLIERDGNLITNYEGAMNDQGLAWDLNGLSPSELNPHPERPYSHAVDNYLTSITRYAATVEEAITMAKEFDFGTSLSYQIHVADASGDAVVISVGPDGELAFTRKPVGDGYLVSTNFNLANPTNRVPGTRVPDSRYTTASDMLDEVAGGSESLTPEYMGSILDAVHLESPRSYTAYSNIFDLSNKYVYIYYLSQFDEVVTLDLNYELSLGEHVYDARNLFTQPTINTGLRGYETTKTLANLAALAGVITVIVGLPVLVFKIVRRRQNRVNRTAPQSNNPSDGLYAQSEKAK